MTPKGFKAWVSRAARGRQIIYFEGPHLQVTETVKRLRDAAMTAYEAGEVSLFQKRITPQQGVSRRTLGTFAYVAVKI